MWRIVNAFRYLSIIRFVLLPFRNGFVAVFCVWSHLLQLNSPINELVQRVVYEYALMMQFECRNDFPSVYNVVKVTAIDERRS